MVVPEGVQPTGKFAETAAGVVCCDGYVEGAAAPGDDRGVDAAVPGKRPAAGVSSVKVWVEESEGLNTWQRDPAGRG